jgi:hypothetical protein
MIWFRFINDKLLKGLKFSYIGETFVVNGRCRGNANASLAFLDLIRRDNTIISLKINRRLMSRWALQRDAFRRVMVSLICHFFHSRIILIINITYLPAQIEMYDFKTFCSLFRLIN